MVAKVKTKAGKSEAPRMLTPAQQALLAELDEATSRLAAIKAKAVDFVDKLEQADDLDRTLRFWFLLRNGHEGLDKERKALDQQIERMSRQSIPQMLDRRKIGTQTLTDIGYRFGTQQRVSCTFVDKENGMEWFRKNGLENLIQETVAPSTLSAWAKDYAEEELKDPPEKLFKMSYMRYTSATKLSSK